MALYPYVATLAVDPVTLVKAAGATGVIYAPEDTSFASPLTATDASGNPIPLTANTDGILPSFYSTLPAVNWRSGSYVFPLVTSQPLPGEKGDKGDSGSDGQDGRDGSNVIPTDQAIASAITTPGTPANTALSSTVAESPAVVEKVKKGDLLFNIRDYGAKGDGLTDDTAAIDSAYTASRGRIFIPRGTFVYNGASLPFVTNRPIIQGAGKGVAIIKLGAASYLIDTSAGIASLLITGLRTTGGKGIFRSTRASGQVQGSYVVIDNEFAGYTGCAIESNSVDMPYWKIVGNLFDAANMTTSIGIALSGLTDGTTIDDNIFLRNRVHVKLRYGGNNAHLRGNDFIRFGPSEGQPRIDVWVVPRSQLANSGGGFHLQASKFGPENLHATDKRVVYADELAGPTNGEQFPDLTKDSVGFIVGHTISAVMLGGSTGAAHPLVYSTTPNVRSSIYGPVTLQGSTPTFIVEYRTPPNRSQTNGDNVIGPIVGDGMGVANDLPPRATNGTGVAAIVDPNGVISSHASAPAAYYGQDPVGYRSLIRTPVSAYILDSGATRTATTDAHGGTDAADLVFPATGGQARAQVAAAEVTVGMPAWIEFDVKAGSISEGIVQMEYGGGGLHLRRVFSMLPGWSRHRFLWTPRDNTATFNLGFLRKNAAEPGGYSLGRVRVYHSREPLNVDGVVLINGVKYRQSVNNGALTLTTA